MMVNMRTQSCHILRLVCLQIAIDFNKFSDLECYHIEDVHPLLAWF